MHGQKLKAVYAAMLRCRIFQTVMSAVGKKRLVPAQYEAVIAGATVHLNQDDLVAPSVSDRLAQLIQGVRLEDLVAESKPVKEHPKGSRIQQSRSHSDAELHVAAGMALACKILQKPLVTLIIHDQQNEEEAWQEPVRFAARRALPIVFIFVTRAVRALEQRAELRIHAQQILPCIRVDGNDAIAVYRVAEESTRRARQGLGPSLIECHVEPGRDSVSFMEGYLQRRQLWQESARNDVARSFTRELQLAVQKSFGKSAAQRAASAAARLQAKGPPKER